MDRFCLIHPCDGRTDRRTNGRMDGQTELRWLRRAKAVAAFARKKPLTSGQTKEIRNKMKQIRKMKIQEKEITERREF